MCRQRLVWEKKVLLKKDFRHTDVKYRKYSKIAFAETKRIEFKFKTNQDIAFIVLFFCPLRCDFTIK